MRKHDIKKLVLKRELEKIGVTVVKGNFVKKSQIKKALVRAYIPGTGEDLQYSSLKERVAAKYCIVAEKPTMFSKLKKVLSKDEAYAILDSAFPEGVDTWVAGGCYLLARALMRIVPNAELMVLMGLTKEQEQAKEITEPQPEHVLIKLGSSLIDGDGVSTERALIRRWKKYEGLVGKCWVEPYNPAKHKADYLDLGNTPTFKKAEVTLSEYLEKNLKG